MLGIVDFYMVPLGLFLKASTEQIGFLVSLPRLLSSFALLFAVRVVQVVGSRLIFVARGALLQSILLVPVAFLAFSGSPWRVHLLITLAVLYRCLESLIGPAWGSLMSDYLPPEKRGSYFGWRSQIVGLAQVVGMGIGGVILFAADPEHAAAGFLTIFLIAASARLVSCWILCRQADLPFHPSPESDFTFLMFLRRFRESNFVKFTFYVAGIVFTTFLSAPYFSVYMLRDLQFDYLTYIAMHLASVLMGLMAVPVWGRHADLVGNAHVLKITGLFVPIIPVLWLVSRNPVYLFLIEFFSGFIWAGFNLCATNFVYDAVTPAKRVRCLGYFNLINGMAVFGGSIIGGFLADRLPPIRGFPILSLFVISGLGRALVRLTLGPSFREVRESHRKVSSVRLFFSVVGIRPLTSENEQLIFPVFRRLRRHSSGFQPKK
ncbi:MAG: MFS transporter [Candidatus Omnitrophica bacterium]|nr:MFS transporter [Candidatus Omnitrophota bacterium]